MKQIYISILFYFFCSLLYGQSFEGKITYAVSFELDEEKFKNMGISKNDIINKMKSENAFYDEIIIYLKGGNYVKVDNSEIEKKVIYYSKNNLVYLLEKESEYVSIIGADNFSFLGNNFPKPEVVKSDTIKIIQGDTCSLLMLNWEGIGEEYYWYNSERLKVNPNLFEKHNLEFLNLILKNTNAYPFEVTKTVSNFVSIKMTLQNYEQTEIEDDIFKIPKLKMPKKNDKRNLREGSAVKVMKIKK